MWRLCGHACGVCVAMPVAQRPCRDELEIGMALTQTHYVNFHKRQQLMSKQVINTHKGVNYCSKDATRAQQQRSESPMVTLNWHACKINTRHVNSTRGTSSKKDVPHSQWHIYPTFQAHSPLLSLAQRNALRYNIIGFTT